MHDLRLNILHFFLPPTRELFSKPPAHNAICRWSPDNDFRAHVCSCFSHTLKETQFSHQPLYVTQKCKKLEKMRLKLGFYQANWRNWRADSKHLTIWKQIRSFLSVSRETCRIKAWLRYWKANWMFGNSRANGTLSPLVVLPCEVMHTLFHWNERYVCLSHLFWVQIDHLRSNCYPSVKAAKIAIFLLKNCIR